MAYHKGGGRRLSKTTSSSDVPMFNTTSEQGRLFVLPATSIMNWIKLSSKHTKRQPYRFSKCSGIPCGRRGDVCGVTWIEDKWTVATNHPQGALPGVRCHISLLFSHQSCGGPKLT